jgi:chromosome segregation ATPase
MSSTDLESLEHELKKELEEFDTFLCDERWNSNHAPKSLSAFEIAEAESEKEELQDRLHILLTRTEDFESQICQVQSNLLNLTVANKSLHSENEILKDVLEKQNCQRKTPDEAEPSSGGQLPENYYDLEYRLAETRAQLARSQQATEDLLLARELLEKELEHERRRREHAEKERDAYSAAYEASLKHFEKWSEKKQHQKPSPFYSR